MPDRLAPRNAGESPPKKVTKGAPTERRREALETLYDVSRTMASTLDFEAALEKIMTLSMGAIGSETASVVLAEEGTGRLILVCSQGLPERVKIGSEAPPGGGIAAWVFTHNQPVLLDSHPADDPRFPLASNRGHIRSALSVPLVGKQGPIGVLSLNNSTRGAAFSEDDLNLLTSIGTQAGIVVENARLHREATEANRQLTLTVERLRNLKACLTNMTSTSLELSLRTLLDSAAEGTNALEGTLTVLDEGDSFHRIEVGFGPKRADLWGADGQDALQKPPGPPPFVNPFTVPPTADNAAYSMVRVLSAEGKAIGVLKLVAHPDGPGFDADDREYVNALVEHASIVMYNSMLYQEAEAGRAALQKAYADLQSKQDQLIESEKLAAIGQLAAKVCHQINNPLTAISGCAQLMQRRVQRDEDAFGDASDYVRNYLSTIMSETERCARITGGLLQLTREQEPTFVEADVHYVIMKALDTMEERYPNRFVVSAEFDFGAPPLVADPQLLSQVFHAVVNNAAEAMNDGDTLTVTTQFLPDPAQDPDGGSLRITFQDTGVGMNAETLRRAGEPFFTTKGNGVGLGLTLSRNILEKHHASLRLDSDEGQGATVTLLLTLNSRKAAPSPPDSP